jgi:hypothetical protein
MTILSRRQFRQHWEDIIPGLKEDSSALWAIEDHYKKKCQWFVCVCPIVKLKDHWLWCDQYCAGHVICYSSSLDKNEEWWGFSHRADIVLWMLRWS